jgi:glyoxylase-like metal-dependent hydrolase (beta-lactamase superfamily II)
LSVLPTVARHAALPYRARGRWRAAALGVALAGAELACAAPRRSVAPLTVPGRSAVALTGGPNASLIYAGRTSAGVLLIDLGWWGHRRALPRVLAELDARPADVALVFLTHAHRDHVAAWPAVRHAQFFVAVPEAARLTGRQRPRGWIPRWADRLRPAHLPGPGLLDVRPFAGDTAFAFGRDTLRAYVVPGHTPGSAVYLFRGVLFVGDAVTHTRAGGFAPARRRYSDDPQAAAASLAALWPRLPPGGVRYVCTAHARCTAFTPAFLRDVAR